MNHFDQPLGSVPAEASVTELRTIVGNLRQTVAAEGRATFGGWRPAIRRAAFATGALNLAHYLAVRRHDLRPLQRALMRYGLSSLGRMEGRVLVALDAVEGSLAVLGGGRPDARRWPPSERRFFRGEVRLAAATAQLFGETADARDRRVLVTLPTEAADDPAFILDLARSGADAVRINCAHDDAAHWTAMAAHARAAGELLGRRIAVLMDIAGPKLRTGEVRRPDDDRRLQAGDEFTLVPSASLLDAGAPSFAAVCDPPSVLAAIEPGAEMAMDDGKLGGTILARRPDGGVLVRVDRTKLGGVKLKPEKGLNFPGSALNLAPLTEKDLLDLDTVALLADMIGYSFVQSRADVALLQRELAERRPDWRSIGIIAKIETRRAVANLPDIIVQAAGSQPFGVMIARGDLAVEIGFARLAEIQEEILWLCEAANVPVIWATQVLESMVKSGLPTRGEMTDAAMAARAECVMLNKGPMVSEAVRALDALLRRMGEHQDKKTPRLRALHSWTAVDVAPPAPARAAAPAMPPAAIV